MKLVYVIGMLIKQFHSPRLREMDFIMCKVYTGKIFYNYPAIPLSSVMNKIGLTKTGLMLAMTIGLYV